MNLSLLDKLVAARKGILATILSTEGHTYKKAGEKALFEVGGITPTHGNLGSQCSEQDIFEHGREVFDTGKPKRITIDSSDESDIHFGYGAFCGGSMDVLLEAVSDNQKTVYREVRALITAGRQCSLVHDLETGNIAIGEGSTQRGDSHWVEEIPALTPLVLFGATPLARTIARFVEETDFLLTVIDWRESYLDRVQGLGYATSLDADCSFNQRAMVLILSQSFERDLTVLGKALRCGCMYVGLLSSTTRRDKMYETLEGQGIASTDLARVRSPVGIDIRGKSDPEIAISIVAELVACKNQ